jgi:alkyl hydroperoxide reductase subunit AhpC
VPTRPHSSATTSNKAPHRIVDEIVRVCKANKVKYVREGNIVMCIWKPGKKELRQLQDEVSGRNSFRKLA